MSFVTVPPNIDDSRSSSDVIVREGSNETLTCKATGFPTPSVKWKRDDNSKITINKTLQGRHYSSKTDFSHLVLPVIRECSRSNLQCSFLAREGGFIYSNK
nr:unnamed protein product [Callosobruchus chinensis]